MSAEDWVYDYWDEDWGDEQGVVCDRCGEDLLEWELDEEYGLILVNVHGQRHVCHRNAETEFDDLT